MQQYCNNLRMLHPDRPRNILESKADNIQNTRTFIAEGVEGYALPDFFIPHNYRLVKLSGYNQFRLVTSEDEAETICLIDLTFLDLILPLRKPSVELTVWKTTLPQHHDMVDAISQRFIRSVLLHYSLVFSASNYGTDERRLWEHMMAWAIRSEGYNGYIYDGKQENNLLTHFTTWEHFYASWMTAYWGVDDDIEYYQLFLISTEKPMLFKTSLEICHLPG